MKFHFKHFNYPALSLAVERKDHEIIKLLLYSNIDFNVELVKATGNYHELDKDGINIAATIDPPNGFVIENHCIVRINTKETTSIYELLRKINHKF